MSTETFMSQGNTKENENPSLPLFSEGGEGGFPGRFPNENTPLSKLGEVILFLGMALTLLILPSAIFCPQDCTFPVIALISIGQNLALSYLILQLLNKRGEPVSKIGLSSQNIKKQVWQGIIFFPLFYFSVGIILEGLTRQGLEHLKEVPIFLKPEGIWQILLAILLVAAVAIGEEIIFRGYLLTRFEEITQSQILSVLLSTMLFTLGHGYEGLGGMLTISYIGLLFSLLYLKQRSLTTVIVLHFLTDLMPMVILPAMEIWKIWQ